MSKNIADLRIVTMGGGTGGFVINSGLVHYPVRPVAICTVFDDGGSTGKLKDEFGALPQGDIRRCLLALANDKDHSLREMFNHRFNNGYSESLHNHNVGNLMLLAAEQIWGRIEGIRRVSNVLKIRGEVLPVSIDNAHLCAKLSDGAVIEGESKIDTRDLSDERTIKEVSLSAKAFICREAHEAILKADIIVMGPGDLYTSIIPNLLVKGVAESISSSNAKVVYVANLMTKWAETRDYTAEDFLKTMCSYGIGRPQFDTVLFNTAPIPPDLVTLYAKQDRSTPVLYDKTMETLLQPYAKNIIGGDFLSKPGLHQELIRHDSQRLAHAILQI